MQRTFQQFVLACLALTIVVAVWVTFFYRTTTTREMVRQEQEHLAELTAAFAQSLRPAIDALVSGRAPGNYEPTPHDAFSAGVEQIGRHSDLNNVRLIGRDGKPLYTRQTLDGDVLESDPRVAQAFAGSPTSGMIGAKSGFFGAYSIDNGDRIGVWMPIRGAGSDEVVAVLAIDWKLDALSDQIARAQRMLAAGLLLGFSALFALLMFAAARAKRLLTRQEQARLRAQQALEEERDAFEQKVQHRTEELNQMVRVLQVEVADRRRNENLIREVAFYDALTKLPNRTLFKTDLERALSEAKRRASRLAVMFIDLDNFKRINDTLGHNMGDELLRQAASRLSGCIRGEDSIAGLIRSGTPDADSGNRVAAEAGDAIAAVG
ncbi:MAG: diguanylate cyclase, partial [Thermomicrobiales bacterium]